MKVKEDSEGLMSPTKRTQGTRRPHDGPGSNHRRAVFTALFDDNYALIVRYVERRVASVAEAEEIAAEVFVVAWEKLDVEVPFDLRWLYRTAGNLVMNHWGRNKTRRGVEERLKLSLLDRPGDSDVLRRLTIVEALNQLTPREAEALRLTVWEGLAAADVAEVLGCSVAAVWKVLSRARQRLRTLLADVELPTSPTVIAKGQTDAAFR